jgi:hypothetical protein
MVKHWLHHASKATAEIAEDLSLEEDFWKKGSLIRWRWLMEYERLTEKFENFDLDQDFPALHIASSVGFTQLVLKLIANGHRDELTLRDKLDNTPVGYLFTKDPIHNALLTPNSYISRPSLGESMLLKSCSMQMIRLSTTGF